MTDRTRATAWHGGPAGRGFTLIEMGFVIGLLGLLGLLASYVYIDRIEREFVEMQDEDAIRDVHNIIDALRAYATGVDKARNEFWPTFDDGCLHLRALAIHGYIRVGSPATNNTDAGGGFSGAICDTTRLEGPTRYVTCGTSRSARCTPYTFHRWNPRTRTGRRTSPEGVQYTPHQYGNTTRLEERRFEHGGNGFHLLFFFGVPGNYNDTDDRARAQAIADRLPNAAVWDSIVTHEMYIVMALFYESSFIRGNQQYIRLDGENRPVIFRAGRGVLGGIRQLTIDDAPSQNPPRPRSASPAPLNDGYPRIRLQPPDPPGRFETQLILMADYTDQQDEAAVTFEHYFNAAVDFTVADRLASQRGSDVTVPHHSLRFSTRGFQQFPALVLRRRTSASLDEFGDVLQMWLRERRPFGPRDWDIDLTSSRSSNSLRTRLCALEHSTDNPDTDAEDPSVPPDVTCP